MSQTKILNRIYKARMFLMLHEPFFGMLSLQCLIKIDTTCDTAYTDGFILGYNPHFVESLTMPELIGLTAHKILHIALSHCSRRNNRDHDTWNEACDYVINLILTKTDSKTGKPLFVLPKGRLLDYKYSDMDADKIYDVLYAKKAKQKSNSSQSGNNQILRNDGACTKDRIPTSDKNRMATNVKSYAACGECRDIASGNNEAVSSAKKRELKNQINVAVHQAVVTAKKMGRLPGGVETLIDRVLEPKLDTQALLQRFMDAASKSDYSYRRPNRRAAANGIISPSLYSNDLGEIAIALDTSASMNKKDLKEMASEISGILQNFSCTIHLINVDTKIQRYETITQDDLPLELTVTGGGGTMFEAVIPYLEEQGIYPSCVLFLSDGYVRKFSPNNEEPAFPCILIQNNEYTRRRPDWLEVVHMK